MRTMILCWGVWFSSWLTVTAMTLAADEPTVWKLFPDDAEVAISALARSENGKLLAVGSNCGDVLLLHAADGTRLPGCESAGQARIKALAFAGNERLAVGDEDGRIRLWELGVTPKLLARATHQRWVNSVVFPPDQTDLISAGSNRTLRRWNWGSADPAFIELGEHAHGLNHVSFSADGTRLIAVGKRATTVWEVPRFQPVMKLPHNGQVYEGRLTPDGRTAVTAADDGTVRVWEVETGKRLQTYTGHAGPVLSVAISPDQRRLASGGFDQTVRIWKLASDDRPQILRGATAPVVSVVWSADGSQVFVAAEEKSLRRHPLAESGP